MRSRLALAILALALALPSGAQAATSGTFKLSTSISEDLRWSVPAQTVECGTYIGSGRTTFSFKSKKAKKILVNSGMIGSPGYIPGGGPQSGSMSVLATTDCMNAKDLVQPTSGCGPMSFAPEFSFKHKGSSSYLTSRIGTSGYDDRNYDCAYFGQLSTFAEGGGLDDCGLKEDGMREIYNEALRAIGAEGITSVKFPFSPKSLLKIKKGKKKRFTKNLVIHCEPVTERGFKVVFDGTLKASLTFKRVS